MSLINKVLKTYNYNQNLHYDKFVEKYLMSSGNKKWLSNILPSELLTRNLKKAIESILSLCECNYFYKEFPTEISTPNYGDNWGRHANYIEINNRAIAEMKENSCRNGLISTIKLMPAIPPSAKSWANCIILSQIFPNIYGDGYNKSVFEENSIYGIELNKGYSLNIIDYKNADKLTAEEQIRFFNDLAHLRGLKTGIRTVISADQIKIAHYGSEDEIFSWKNKEHEELFINEHVKLAELGFEAFFIDSAKHIGNYDMKNYTGVGAIPEYAQMQYIIQEIRKRSKKTTLSFVGEKSTDDFERYKNLGLNSGTGFINPDNYDEVKNWSIKFKYDKVYAPGLEVSNDNDEGGRRYEDRISRLHNCLLAYEYPSDKLASFSQMEDLFPLRYDTSTHKLMMTNPSFSTDGTEKSHWENLFSKDDARKYNQKAGEIYQYALNL